MPQQSVTREASFAQAGSNLARLPHDGEGLFLLARAPEAVGSVRVRPGQLRNFGRERFEHLDRLLGGAGRLLPFAQLPQRPGQRAQVLAHRQEIT